MESTMTYDMTPDEIIKTAEALVGENLELRRELDVMRGRLRESRKCAAYYRAQYREALRYKFDAEADFERDRARRRELTVAAVGAAVLLTCLLFVGAVVGGWRFC